MINQLLAGVQIVAAAEAMALAAKQNPDLDKVYEVITGSAGNSWMFENRVPHILSGDYTPLSSVGIFVKNLGIISDMARATISGTGWRMVVNPKDGQDASGRSSNPATDTSSGMRRPRS